MSVGCGYRRSILPPRGGSRAWHECASAYTWREDEAYYVLSEELEVIVADEVFVLRTGDTLIAPRDIPHQLRNSGNAENQYLLVFSPPGSRGFWRRRQFPHLTMRTLQPSHRQFRAECS
jgi:mannose-6-phosphate isomerase-like protein (cupin superfamily)